jgi:hypothetical protein
MKYKTEVEVTDWSEQEILDHVSGLSKQLGGMGLAYERDAWSGKRTYARAGSRHGYSRQTPRWHMNSLTYHDAPYDCFGKELVPYARPKANYAELDHYTISTCKRSCWKKNIVICVRTLNKSGRKHLSIHVAGDCPYTYYDEKSRSVTEWHSLRHRG